MRPIYPFDQSIPVNPESPIYIKIEPRDQGGVLVVAVNADGTREAHSQILSINSDGQVHLKGNLNPDLGFPLVDGAIEQV